MFVFDVLHGIIKYNIWYQNSICTTNGYKLDTTGDCINLLLYTVIDNKLIQSPVLDTYAVAGMRLGCLVPAG